MLQQSWFYDPEFNQLAGAFGKNNFSLNEQRSDFKIRDEGAFCISGKNLYVTYYQTKEALIKSLHRHAGEYQHPVNNCFDWILAYARMTTQRIFGLIQRFPKYVPKKIYFKQGSIFSIKTGQKLKRLNDEIINVMEIDEKKMRLFFQNENKEYIFL